MLEDDSIIVNRTHVAHAGNKEKNEHYKTTWQKR
jgi:hypothetical protein